MLLRLVFVASLPSVFSYNFDTQKQLQSSQYSANGEKGESGYIGGHLVQKGRQGQHDKENHRKDYAEEDGHRQGQLHKNGYYDQKHRAQNGEEGYSFDESGKFAKGHKTKGRHNVHKLKEYKKNTDFFDEKNDDLSKEKHGGYERAKAAVSGVKNGGGFYKNVFFGDKYGLAGFKDKGVEYVGDSGHSNTAGQEEGFRYLDRFDKKDGLDEYRKFGFRNANFQ